MSKKQLVQALRKERDQFMLYGSMGQRSLDINLLNQRESNSKGLAEITHWDTLQLFALKVKMGVI